MFGMKNLQTQYNNIITILWNSGGNQLYNNIVYTYKTISFSLAVYVYLLSSYEYYVNVYNIFSVCVCVRAIATMFI